MAHLDNILPCGWTIPLAHTLDQIGGLAVMTSQSNPAVPAAEMRKAGQNLKDFASSLPSDMKFSYTAPARDFLVKAIDSLRAAKRPDLVAKLEECIAQLKCGTHARIEGKQMYHARNMGEVRQQLDTMEQQAARRFRG